ncbi:MAG: ferrous iron transport protein A [Verrucomicrobiales bacterium]|jgi:Fe2+ transport system protein FeoA|nr:ferrous iron transport protein A [Verrucomicrobiales bacterium]
MKYLSELQPGERADILSVNTVSDIARQLLVMGLLPGVTVEVAGVAPFGDPLTVKIRNRPVSLRRAEAALVMVEPAPPSPLTVSGEK